MYVAPPGVHLMVSLDRRIELSHLPPLHYCRPSGDRLFTSVGRSFGRAAIAVVLTGTGCDGADGAQDLRRFGGTVIVQDEPSSQFPGMPHAAVQAGTVDRVLPLNAIARALKEEEAAVLRDLRQAIGKEVQIRPDLQLHHEQFDVMAI